MNAVKCQMQDKDAIHEGRPQPVILSFRSRLILTISNHIDPQVRRSIKKRLKLLTGGQSSREKTANVLPKTETAPFLRPLQKGDLVRVRSVDEIRATLNSKNRLKGLKFLPEMEPYCGTTQRVHKNVERFLNECDYTVRKGKGLILLENVFCEGIAGAGRCDRSCFYFWRAEWLEFLAPGDGHQAS